MSSATKTVSVLSTEAPNTACTSTASLAVTSGSHTALHPHNFLSNHERRLDAGYHKSSSSEALPQTRLCWRMRPSISILKDEDAKWS